MACQDPREHQCDGGVELVSDAECIVGPREMENVNRIGKCII